MKNYMEIAVRAAREAGALLRANFEQELVVNATEAHDIKLELDVRTQELIESIVLGAEPESAIYGEEGISGDPGSLLQWIIDPIDGTVNYFYGIPHFCVSIALRREGELVLGVIYDPMRDELWTVEKGGPAFLNGREICVSKRENLSDAIVVVGFSKTSQTINAGLPLLERMIRRVRKCRLMGSAALDLAYVATGRLDAFIEQGVSLWDIAAGQMLVEAAGGKFRSTPREDDPAKLAVVASNGRMDLGV